MGAASALLVAVAGPPSARQRPIDPAWIAFGILAFLGAVAIYAETRG